ncbi:uncharacterized protein LOC143057699 [Mytilus galloprovincialis]|uniref:Death domain-containing protein n=1 Tax=Mytilus galloprovincialis TaxID=29158 RepID=A0A8B6G482_MYTGA|nr:Hypothetical predicted protein [Mytilus galloprovincialis]VDI58336.1 Hypothetical predicted protein [Mytilus galloprovincialis]
MVKETTTLGDGRSADSFRPQDIQVPNIVVWESTRQVQNWELAYVSEKIAEQPKNQWRIRQQMETIYGRQKLEYLEDRDRALKGEVFYTCLLKWRRQQENGLAQICKLAQLLRETGFLEVAESLQP